MLNSIFDFYDDVDSISIYDVVCDCGMKVVVVVPSDEDSYNCSNCNVEIALDSSNLKKKIDRG